MQKYVLGFVFTNDGRRVVLIRKQKPIEQAGLLNGVGGKVEPGEKDEAAMIREFREEAGVELLDGWRHYATMGGPGWSCAVFSNFDTTAFARASTQEVENIEKHHLHTLVVQTTMPSLRWLIPLALDANSHGMPFALIAYAQ